MAKEAIGENLYVGSGKLYLDRLDAAGAKTGERFIGNVDSIEITPTVETISKKSSAVAARTLLNETVIGKEIAIAIQFNEYTRENLAAFLMGTEISFSQSSGGPVTDEAVDNVQQGRFYALGGNTPVKSINTVVVTGSAGTPTYVEGTDYDVDALHGRIYIIPGGGIANDTDLLVDYSFGAVTYPSVAIAQAPVIQAFLRFIGDPTEGQTFDLDIWKVSITPEGSMQLISDEYGASILNAKILEDAVNHPTTPFGIAMRRAA